MLHRLRLTCSFAMRMGHPRSRGIGLERTASGPMVCLHRDDDQITLEDLWPGPDELGCLVILTGGEVGVLRSWWHADDHSAWRWQLELSNHQ